MSHGIVTLVLGGARSGKSAHAEELIAVHRDESDELIYIATAEAWDDEMRARIASHQDRRGEHWRTIEAPLDLTTAIKAADHAGSPVLIDCLTIWLSNLMHHERDVDAALDDLVDTLAGVDVPVVVVSNELGLGIVPENAMARRFRDAHGRMNQKVAAAASRVVFVAAGLPLTLKD